MNENNFFMVRNATVLPSECITEHIEIRNERNVSYTTGINSKQAQR